MPKSSPAQMETHPSTDPGSKVIIPYITFGGNYLKILYSVNFPDILTNREKEILKILNGFAYKNGKCYPRQSTIASKACVCTRTVQRTLSSLAKKKFISIEKPDLIHRHLFRRTNRYRFLWHKAYGQVMSHEMTPETQTAPLLNNQQSLKPEDNHYAALQRALPAINAHCAEIDKYQTRFDPRAFFRKYMKNYHPLAIEEALSGILSKMPESLSTGALHLMEWWGYGLTIVRRVNGNHNEQDHIRQSAKLQNAPPPDFLQPLLRRIG